MKLLNNILSIPRELGKLAIKFYQFFFSFDHAFWSRYTDHRVCLHEPSCSQYTYEAIDMHGLVKGSVMGGFRVIRCNPIQGGGYDPVPDHFSIRANKVDLPNS